MGAGKHHVSLWEKACQALKGDRNDGDGDDDDVGDDGDDDGGGNDDNEDDLYIIRNMIGAVCLSDLTPRCWLSIKFNGSITKFKRRGS